MILKIEISSFIKEKKPKKNELVTAPDSQKRKILASLAQYTICSHENQH